MSFKIVAVLKSTRFPGTDSEAFEFASELIVQDASAAAGLSSELVSVEDALDTAQIAAEEAKKQLSSLQRNHDLLENSLLAGFNKTQATCKREKGALREQAETSENNLFKIPFTKNKRVMKLPAD